MKTLICPMSNEKVPEHQVRIVAFLGVSVLIAYMLTGFGYLLAFLSLDFLMRTLNKSKYSLLAIFASVFSRHLNIQSKWIDKAPKLFAARLGFVMLFLATLVHFWGLSQLAFSLAAVVAVLATLECVFGLCLGCYIYSWLVLPLSKSTLK